MRPTDLFSIHLLVPARLVAPIMELMTNEQDCEVLHVKRKEDADVPQANGAGRHAAFIKGRATDHTRTVDLVIDFLRERSPRAYERIGHHLVSREKSHKSASPALHALRVEGFAVQHKDGSWSATDKPGYVTIGKTHGVRA